MSRPGPRPATVSPWVLRSERAAVLALAWVGATGVLAVGLSALLGGRDSAVGGAIGLGLALLVVAITWVSVRLARDGSARELALLLIAGYGAKIASIAGAVALLRAAVGDETRTAFALTAGLGVVLGVVVESVVVTRTRAPYVEP